MLQIQAFTSADFDEWLTLWKGYQSFYKAEMSAAQDRLTWQRLLALNEPMWGLGAFEADRLLGIVHFIFHRSCWTEGDYCYLQDLFVDPKTRGRGIGRALIDAVKQRAQSSGASRVYWLTHESNVDAQQLYDQVAERSGFIQYRIKL